METRQSEELTLRQYLLGRLDTLPETTQHMEERMLTDKDYAELTSVIEDEIIEDYLEGILDPKDNDAVEKHFLNPPERRERLRLARLVNQRLKMNAESGNRADSIMVPLSQVNPDVSGSWWRPGVRLWSELAAGLLVVISLVYSIKSHQEVRTSRELSNQQISAEHDHAVQADRKLQDLRAMVQPATVMLSLLRPGVSRGDASLPNLRIGSATQRIHVEIAFQSAPPGPVDVRLETLGGKIIWTANGVTAFRSNQAAILILDVPAHGIGSGGYQFVVSQPNKIRLVYLFEATL